MSALTDLFTAFANKIRSKTGGSDTYTPPQMVNAIDDVYQAGVDAGTTPTQTKTVTAGTSSTTVTPDTGYALSSVKVYPTPSQSKYATPTTSSQTITPDSGKLLSSVSVGAIQTETISATPNVSTTRTVTPSSGKYLSQVTIPPLTHSGTYTPAANTAQNDMGAYHDKRYVNTSGMIVPSGNKSITANGTGIDVSNYATASVAVPDPTTNALSPSNSSPQELVGKAYYRDPNTSATTIIGYAIKGYTNVDLTAYGQQVRIGGGMLKVNIDTSEMSSAFVVGGSIDDVTPTADGEYFSSGVKSMTRPGWAYLEQQQGADLSSWASVGSTSAKGTYTVPTKGAYLFYTWGYTEKNGGAPGTPGAATFTRNGTSCSASIDKTDSFSFAAGSGTRYVKHRKQMIIDMFDAGETVYSSKAMTVYSTAHS